MLHYMSYPAVSTVQDRTQAALSQPRSNPIDLARDPALVRAIEASIARVHHLRESRMPYEDWHHI